MANFISDTVHLFEPITRLSIKRSFFSTLYVGFGCLVRKCPYSNKFCKDCNFRYSLHK